jgi:hypothetical protein
MSKVSLLLPENENVSTKSQQRSEFKKRLRCSPVKRDISSKKKLKNVEFVQDFYAKNGNVEGSDFILTCSRCGKNYFVSGNKILDHLINEHTKLMIELKLQLNNQLGQLKQNNDE